MNLYETVKASVSVPEAAERYGLDVGRTGMARCIVLPFAAGRRIWSLCRRRPSESPRHFAALGMKVS